MRSICHRDYVSDRLNIAIIDDSLTEKKTVLTKKICLEIYLR